MPFGISESILIGSAIGSGGSILGGLFGSSAAKKAAQQKADADQRALDFQKQVWGQQQENIRPYQEAGATSIASLMDALKSGKFGAGSNPNFAAPSLAEVQQTPGYQFAQQQGARGILEASAATGGSFSGGTSRALQTFGTGLADSTYGQAFQRSLAGYQANLQKQGQEFNQTLAPAQLGEAAVTGLNNTGSRAAENAGGILMQQGADQASGTIGSANSIVGGINGAANAIGSGLTLGNLFKFFGPQGNVIGRGSGGGGGIDPALISDGGGYTN